MSFKVNSSSAHIRFAACLHTRQPPAANHHQCQCGPDVQFSALVLNSNLQAGRAGSRAKAFGKKKYLNLCNKAVSDQTPKN